MSPWKPLRKHRSEIEPTRIADSIDQVARRVGMTKASATSGIFGRWSEVVGESVAAHSKPHSLRDGVLKVVVDESAWATQIRYLSSTIVQRCNEVAGDGAVTTVEVRVGR